MIFTGFKFKNTDYMKKISNKSCWEFNFQQKIQLLLMSISSRSGVSGLKRLLRSKYYNVPKGENRLTLNHNVAKNSDYMKKNLMWKLLKIEFPTKNSAGTACLSPPVWGKGARKIACLKYYNVLKRENRLTVGLNVAKNDDYMKK